MLIRINGDLHGANVSTSFGAWALYETLTPGRPIRNRKLMWVRVRERPDKEAIMLDVAFVALGLAVLALMGVLRYRPASALGGAGDE